MGKTLGEAYQTKGDFQARAVEVRCLFVYPRAWSLANAEVRKVIKMMLVQCLVLQRTSTLSVREPQGLQDADTP